MGVQFVSLRVQEVTLTRQKKSYCQKLLFIFLFVYIYGKAFSQLTFDIFSYTQWQWFSC